MVALSLDWETKSVVDLPERGLDNYAADPSTDILCGAYAFGDEDPELWLPGQPCPPRIAAHVRAGGEVRAWNAAFEIAIWRRIATPRYGWPELRLDQVRCAMAEAAAMALPLALERAGPALGLDTVKDDGGKRVMRLLCQPKDDGTWHSPDADRELFERLYLYNLQDVRAEQAISRRTVRLSADEQRLWVLDQAINNRGFAIDVPAVRAAEKIVRAEVDRINGRIAKLTDNAITAVTNVGQLKAWVESRGVKMDTTRKSAVAELLAGPLPSDVRQVLLLRQEGARTSTAKLDRALSRMSADGRVRGTMQFHGAATGRWAGRDVQPHNWPRPREGVDYDTLCDWLAEAGDAL